MPDDGCSLPPVDSCGNVSARQGPFDFTIARIIAEIKDEAASGRFLQYPDNGERHIPDGRGE
jgi:hypothetical protein